MKKKLKEENTLPNIAVYYESMIIEIWYQNRNHKYIKQFLRQNGVKKQKGTHLLNEKTSLVFQLGEIQLPTSNQR